MLVLHWCKDIALTLARRNQDGTRRINLVQRLLVRHKFSAGKSFGRGTLNLRFSLSEFIN